MIQPLREVPDVAAHLAERPRISVFGVDYLHLRLEGGSDLYVTEGGLPFVKLLLPENYWTDEDWSAKHRTKLPGTSSVYKVTTKEVDGRSKDIVLKWNRMGQDIPGETQASDLLGAEFNSPFQEFGLVAELREACRRVPGQLCTHRPLAIYVPRKYVEVDRLGRKQYKMDAMQRKHGEIMLDSNRQYAVVYEWIKGIDAALAFRNGLIDQDTMERLFSRSNQELSDRGFLVRDNKPHHIIVRPKPSGELAADRAGDILYALVDFELLDRTPQHEQAVRASKRETYLAGQAHRFEKKASLPPELTPVNIMGVDYVFGQVEGTAGALWVVGNDPVLFEYFLPEKWRKTSRQELSTLSPVYETITKDNIHLVWRVSRVGQLPDADPFLENEKRILDHGYNSPFEEFSHCMHLAKNGVETTYPRAIYMSGHKAQLSGALPDSSRYSTHEPLTTPVGHPILSEDHDYITLWGYWNGPDELLASKDEEYYKGIDALRALRKDLITEEVYLRTMQITREQLAEAGVEQLDLRGNHLLLSQDRSGQLVMGTRGVPAARICNFELLKRADP